MRILTLRHLSVRRDGAEADQQALCSHRRDLCFCHCLFHAAGHAARFLCAVDGRARVRTQTQATAPRSANLDRRCVRAVVFGDRV